MELGRAGTRKIFGSSASPWIAMDGRDVMFPWIADMAAGRPCYAHK
jgi:hypothetical protein